MIRTLCNMLVVLVCVLTLPACGGSPTGPTPDPTPIPEPVPIPEPTPEPEPEPTPEPQPTPEPPPVVLPPTTAYDGSWIGGGTGTASDSTPVTVGVELEVVDGAIKSWTINYNFRDATPPMQKNLCRRHINGGRVPIIGNSFLNTIVESKFALYTPTIFKGTFSSTVAVAGTITLVYTIPLQSPEDLELRRACPASATLEWSAKKR